MSSLDTDKEEYVNDIKNGDYNKWLDLYPNKAKEIFRDVINLFAFYQMQNALKSEEIVKEEIVKEEIVKEEIVKEEIVKEEIVKEEIAVLQKIMNDFSRVMNPLLLASTTIYYLAIYIEKHSTSKSNPETTKNLEILKKRLQLF